MSVVAKTESQLPVIIDIDGPDGNAFVLMGYANSTMRKLSLIHI